MESVSGVRVYCIILSRNEASKYDEGGMLKLITLSGLGIAIVASRVSRTRDFGK